LALHGLDLLMIVGLQITLWVICFALTYELMTETVTIIIICGAVLGGLLVIIVTCFIIYFCILKRMCLVGKDTSEPNLDEVPGEDQMKRETHTTASNSEQNKHYKPFTNSPAQDLNRETFDDSEDQSRSVELDLRSLSIQEITEVMRDVQSEQAILDTELKLCEKKIQNYITNKSRKEQLNKYKLNSGSLQ